MALPIIFITTVYEYMITSKLNFNLEKRAKNPTKQNTYKTPRSMNKTNIQGISN